MINTGLEDDYFIPTAFFHRRFIGTVGLSRDTYTASTSCLYAKPTVDEHYAGGGEDVGETPIPEALEDARAAPIPRALEDARESLLWLCHSMR